MDVCVQLVDLRSVCLSVRRYAQVTPGLTSVFSYRSSEVSTNTSLIDEAVSNLGEATFVNLTYEHDCFSFQWLLDQTQMSL